MGRALTLLLAFASACTGESDDPATDAPETTDVGWEDAPCNDGASSVTLGHFEGLSFTPLDDPGAAQLVHGPQGGWHLELDLRVTGAPRAVHTSWTVVDPESGLDLTNGHPGRDIGLIGDGSEVWGCSGTYDDLPVEFDPRLLVTDEQPVGWQAICNRPLDVTVRLTTLEGEAVAVTQIGVIPIPWPEDVEASGPCPREIP